MTSAVLSTGALLDSGRRRRRSCAPFWTSARRSSASHARGRPQLARGARRSAAPRRSPRRAACRRSLTRDAAVNCARDRLSDEELVAGVHDFAGTHELLDGGAVARRQRLLELGRRRERSARAGPRPSRSAKKTAAAARPSVSSRRSALSVSVRPKPIPAIHATTSSGTATARTTSTAVRTREPCSAAGARNSAVTAGRNLSPATAPLQCRRVPQARLDPRRFRTPFGCVAGTQPVRRLRLRYRPVTCFQVGRILGAERRKVSPCSRSSPLPGARRARGS